MTVCVLNRAGTGLFFLFAEIFVAVLARFSDVTKCSTGGGHVAGHGGCVHLIRCVLEHLYGFGELAGFFPYGGKGFGLSEVGAFGKNRSGNIGERGQALSMGSKVGGIAGLAFQNADDGTYVATDRLHYRLAVPDFTISVGHRGGRERDAKYGCAGNEGQFLEYHGAVFPYWYRLRRAFFTFKSLHSFV